MVLRSSPTWNGRCWLHACCRAVKIGHRVAILTDLEWPVLVITLAVHVQQRLAVAILTDLEWPVLAPDRVLVVQARLVAILTDLEWPVLAPPRVWPRRLRTGCDPHRLGMAGAGMCTIRGARRRAGRCDPHRLGMAGAGMSCPAVLSAMRVLRSSPTWNGRCWSPCSRRARRSRSGCDPHRLGMAGAGESVRLYFKRHRNVAILTDLEWPVLVSAKRHTPVCFAVAILTDLEWPVLARRHRRVVHDSHRLRSSPTWNGRCWAAE